MKRLKVYLLGLKDGYDQYPNFGTGMTYNDSNLNEAYDRGVNLGELLASLVPTGILHKVRNYLP